MSEIDKEIQRDPTLSKNKEELLQNPNSHGKYTLEHDRLYYKGKLVLTANSEWIPKLLQEFHSSLSGGHSGV